MKMKNSKRSGNARRKIATPAAPPIVQNILVPTDFSDASRFGVRYAVALAEKLGAAVALLAGIEDSVPAIHGDWVHSNGRQAWPGVGTGAAEVG
jgi:SpoU rRNA methylase family enzyme